MKIFYCKIHDFADLRGSEYLLPQRRERMYRYIRNEDRARCLVGGLMLRHVLGKGYGEYLAFGPYEKPYLKEQDVFFNLSHSVSYAVIAVSHHEVGVDVEHVSPYSLSVAEKCFTAEEMKWLLQHRNRRDFYRLWTGKESVMKAVGDGLSMAPESFDIMPVEDGPHKIRGKTWYLYWAGLEEYEICAACAADEDVEMIEIKRSELLAERC